MLWQWLSPRDRNLKSLCVQRSETEKATMTVTPNMQADPLLKNFLSSRYILYIFFSWSGNYGLCCSKTTLKGESQFHISIPLEIEPRSLMMGSIQVTHWTSGTVYEWSEIAGSPQGSPQQPTMLIVNQKEDLQRVWNRDRKAVWDQVGLSHCRHDGLVMVWDEACHIQATMINHVEVINVARQR